MGRRRGTTEDAPKAPRVRSSEQLLIDAIPDLQADRVLCTSLGRAQFAERFAASHPSAQVVCHFLELYLAEQARAAVGDEHGNLSIVCEADLPAGEVDLVAIPVTKTGDAELTRDLMQAGHVALRVGGRMATATDNPRDTWLHGEMEKLFEKVTRRPSPAGVLYLATKTAELKKVRGFDAEFAFRDEGRLITAFSRPGVFSHRRLDLGSRALLETMTVNQGDRVLDLGCGAGALSLAAALRAPDVKVLAVDSNPRAVQCTLKGAAHNGLANVAAQLSADAQVEPAGEFNLVVTNPPYYSNFRIAEVFLAGALRALRPGGTVLVVTKNPDWFFETMSDQFDDVDAIETRTYFVVSGRARRGRRGKR